MSKMIRKFVKINDCGDCPFYWYGPNKDKQENEPTRRCEKQNFKVITINWKIKIDPSCPLEDFKPANEENKNAEDLEKKC